MEQSSACGSNNKTYATPCALFEESMRLKSPSSLKLQHLGPCESRPWIVSPSKHVSSTPGHYIALNCEVKGFPIPDIYWEFQSADGKQVLKLPGMNPRYYIINILKKHCSFDSNSLIKFNYFCLFIPFIF